ncbi:ATP-binding cassette domain-containing protein [Bacillus halotolerans]|nr:ATP-binding cassette domain-containing protein [Bacillus halotolerans]
MIQIDPRSSTPIYEQIIQQMKELCLKGIMKPGDKLPSVRELATIIIANPNTVSKAYKELEREGIIETLRGRGTYISENAKTTLVEGKMTMIKEQLKQLIIDAHYAGVELDKLQEWIKEISADVKGARAMIELRQLSKTIDGNQVLKDVSLTIKKGEIFGLLGRNGSGKTTMLRLIQQIIFADSGTILFDGVEIKKHPKVKQNIIYMPVQNPFYDKYTYKQLVDILRRIYPKFDVTYANELMNRYEIPETKKYRELSTGLKKQLSLVLSFAARPALILLDEPTDGIDAVTRHDVLQLMVDEVAERDTSILITSHRLEDIERMCNRIGFLEDNRLTNVMDLDELKEEYIKIQMAFDTDVNLAIREQNIPMLDQAGVFYTVLIPKSDEKNKSFLRELKPKVWNELPVNLEEVFIAKFGGKRRW